jgi:hypothetical protein
LETVQQHLAGELTLGIYAIHPHTQRSKWVAIDADNKNALVDLLKVQNELQEDMVQERRPELDLTDISWSFYLSDMPTLRKRCFRDLTDAAPQCPAHILV